MYPVCVLALQVDLRVVAALDGEQHSERLAGGILQPAHQLVVRHLGGLRLAQVVGAGEPPVQPLAPLHSLGLDLREK